MINNKLFLRLLMIACLGTSVTYAAAAPNTSPNQALNSKMMFMDPIHPDQTFRVKNLVFNPELKTDPGLTRQGFTVEFFIGSSTSSCWKQEVRYTDIAPIIVASCPWDDYCTCHGQISRVKVTPERIHDIAFYKDGSKGGYFYVPNTGEKNWDMTVSPTSQVSFDSKTGLPTTLGMLDVKFEPTTSTQNSTKMCTR